MSESTEGAPGAIAGVLDIVAFGRLVDLGMELLFSPEQYKIYVNIDVQS